MFSHFATITERDRQTSGGSISILPCYAYHDTRS